MPDVDNPTRDLIRRLASNPDTVLVHEHAMGNMLARSITLDDVREAICRCIDNGDRVKQTKVKSLPETQVGNSAYVVKQSIRGHRFYIRIVVFQPTPHEDALLVVSAHLDV